MGWSGDSYDVRPQGYNGTVMRAAVAAGRYLGIGRRGCSHSPCYRVAVLEYRTSGVADLNYITADHYAYRKSLFVPTSRVTSRRNCTSLCSTESSAPSVATHGTAVTGTIAQSIEYGQDANFTNTVSRVDRSGIAPDVNISYYRIENGASTANALEAALFEGAYVANFSSDIGADIYPYTAFSNNGGLNGALRNYAAYEGVFVSSAGNGNTVAYPGVRPESVTVGGVDSSNAGTPYGSTGLYPGSGQGTYTITVNGSGWANAPVNLVAPGYVDLRAGLQGTYGNWFGTSFSAPIVAGLAALFRDTFSAATDGRLIQAALLAMGDGWTGAGTGTMTTGTSPIVGAGRVRILPQTFWGWRSLNISQNQVVCFNVGGVPLTGYASWKWGVTWNEPDLGNAADIDIFAKDVATGFVIATQSDHNIHNRIRLTNAQITGRSIQACIRGYHVPIGQTRTVYSADFIQSGTPD